MLLSDARRIGRVALPLYLSMVAVSVGALVTTAALGRHGTGALAAFTVTAAVYFPAVAAVSGAVRGVMPFMRTGDPARVVRDGAWLAVAVGLVGAVAVACVPVIARASGVEREIVGQLGALPLLMAVSVLVSGFGSMASSGLVGLGHGKVVMLAGLAGAACTAVLSPVLVGWFGLDGAGIALCAANLVSAIMTVLGLRRRLSGRPGWRVHCGHVLELAKVGVPMAGTVLVKFAVLGVLAVAAARMSTTAAAAHNIATALVNLTFTAAVAIGQAVVPEVSGRTDRAGVRRVVTAGLVITTVALAAVCAIILFGDVVPLFTGDHEVAGLVTALLPVLVPVVLADGLQAVLGFGLAGLKRTTPSFLVFASCYGLLAVFAFAAGNLTVLWAALALANLAVGVGQGLAFRRASNL